MNRKLKEEVEKKFRNTVVKIIEVNRMVIKTKKESLLSTLLFLKNEGFRQLKAISCVDWIKKRNFELVYHISSLDNPLHIMVKIEVERDNPKIDTIVSVFENAQFYEREIHELFGVNFIGNPDLSPLLLENWKEIPPFRKDFDTREYVKETFGKIPNVGREK